MAKPHETQSPDRATDDPRATSPLPLRLGALGGLKKMLETGDWGALAATLEQSEVWAFDRPLDGASAVALLREVLGGSSDRSLIVMNGLRDETRDGIRRSSFTCCLVWDEPGTFQDHEYEFDLHLGARVLSDDAWSLVFVGLTPPTPEEIPFPDDLPRRDDEAAPPALVPRSVLELLRGAKDDDRNDSGRRSRSEKGSHP